MFLKIGFGQFRIMIDIDTLFTWTEIFRDFPSVVITIQFPLKICIKRKKQLVERFIKDVKMCFICSVIVDILLYYISTQFVSILDYIKLNFRKFILENK